MDVVYFAKFHLLNVRRIKNEIETPARIFKNCFNSSSRTATQRQLNYHYFIFVYI